MPRGARAGAGCGRGPRGQTNAQRRRLVTATRWALPTSFAFHRLAGLPESVRPLTEAVVAVDTAHEDPDPVHRLGRWQREQLHHWRTGGRIDHSPLLWAAMTCVVT